MLKEILSLFTRARAQAVVHAPARKAAATSSSSVVLFEGTSPQYPSWDMAAQITEGHETNSVVYACVNLIAKTASSVRWCLFKNDGTKRQEIEDKNHPLIARLNRPNNLMGGTVLSQTTFTFLLITGNSFTWANRVTGTPVELWNLRPDRFRVTPGTKLGQVKEYEYHVQGIKQVFRPEDVLHLKLFQSFGNEWFGLSPVYVGRLLIDMDNKAVNWNRGLLENGCKFDSIFNFKNGLTETQRATFEQQLKEKSGTAGEKLIIEGGEFTYERMGGTPQEMDFTASTSMTGRRICQLFGVAPELIGDPQNKTYANQMEARIALVEQVVFPLLDQYRGELNNWLAPMYGEGLELDYDKDSIDVISEKRLQVYTSLASADFLTLNEKRAQAGYDKIEHPDADTPDRLLGLAAVEDMQEDQDAEDEADDSDEEPEDEGFPPEDEEKSFARYECKFLNVDTEEKKLSFWNDMDKRRKAFERPAAKLLRKFFVGEKERVVKAVEAKGQAGIAATVNGSLPALRGALKSVYSQVGRYFFRQSAGAISRSGKKDVTAALRGMQAFFSAEIDRKAKLILDTTQRKLVKLLEEAIFAGEDDEQVVGRIETLYEEEFEPNRSVTIAETETGNAANMGTVYGAKSTDKELRKVWVSQRDDRVRDHHQQADSQKVRLNDLFNVKGEQLEFPGDDSHGASPDNTVNCRCYVAFEEAS